MQATTSNSLPAKVVERVSFFKIAVAIGVVCYFAPDIVIPFVIAGMISYLLRPAVTFLDRWGIPHALSCILTLFLGIGVMLAVGGYVYSQLSGISQDYPKWFEKLRDVHIFMLHQFHQTGTSPSAGESIFYLKPEFWADAGMKVISHLTLIAAESVLVIFSVFFLLRDGRILMARILVASGARWAVTQEILDKIDMRIHTYLVTVFLIEATLATVIGCVLWLFGVPYAFVWGLLSGVLGLIPFIGATIAAIPPVLVTLAEYEGYERALGVLSIYIFLQILDGKFITPLLVGRKVNLSPLAILVSTVFWGWIWGPLGMLLATPLLVCFKVIAENISHAYPISVLLGGTAIAESAHLDHTPRPHDPAIHAAAQAVAQIAESTSHNEDAIPAETPVVAAVKTVQPATQPEQSAHRTDLAPDFTAKAADAAAIAIATALQAPQPESAEAAERKKKQPVPANETSIKIAAATSASRKVKATVSAGSDPHAGSKPNQ